MKDTMNVSETIDYQVGDIVIPKSNLVKPELCLIKDITETGAMLSLIEYDEIEFFVPRKEMHLMTKHQVGSLLYGKKG